MKEILIAILIPQIILLPFYFAIRKGRRKREDDIPKNDEMNMDMADVLNLIRGVYKSLSKQNARGYGLWLTTCIRKIQAGEDVPIGTVLIALKWTRDELRGPYVSRHYDLGEIGRAILALEVAMGEWG